MTNAHPALDATMRISVLTQYLIRVHVGPFLFALSTITGLIFLNAVALRVDDLVGKGLPWTVVAEFLVLSLPHTIALSLPMSVLVAVLYAFSDLTASNEIMAMSAGGIRPTRIMLPLLAMGTLMAGVMLYFNDRILPESNHALKNLLLDIGRKSPTLELQERVVNEIQLGAGASRYFLTADEIDPVGNTLLKVTIFDGNDPSNQRTTYAERGEMAFNPARTDLFLTLYDGVVHEVRNDREGGFQRVYFQEQILPLRGVGNELERQFGGADRSDREMGFALLRQNVTERQAALDSLHAESLRQTMYAARLALNLPIEDSTGMGALGLLARDRQFATTNPAPMLGPSDRLLQEVITGARARATRGESLEQSIDRFQVEIHKKFAIAIACIVFALLGPPLALRFPRGGVGMVVAASTLIFSIYWVGLIGGESLADRRVADPAVTMWLSNVVFTLLGLALVSRMGVSAGTVRGGGRGGGARWRRLREWVTPRVRLHGGVGGA